MNQAEQLIREISKGLLKWYDFKPHSNVLYTGNSHDPAAEALAEMSLQVVSVPSDQIGNQRWQQTYQNYFDYVVCIEALETEPHPQRVLIIFRKLLKTGGRLLLGMNNRLGIRYFCGDRDPYTERNFDGIEDYCRAYVKKEDVFRGRMYSQAELKRLLRDTGWESFRFFSVLPDLKNPCLIYAEDYLPNEDLASRLFPTYHEPGTVFLEEQRLYTTLADNGMFHTMANAYLVEGICDRPVPEEDAAKSLFSDISQVTCSLERGREFALFTIIYRTGMVEKRAAYPAGRKRLENLVRHGQELAARGIPVVNATMEDGVCRMPYIDSENGQVCLKRLLLTDQEEFLNRMDHFRDLILQSSEIIEPDKGDGSGPLLKRGYLDMVPLNSFYINGTFVFYDQEFCEYNYPANAIITRMIATFYAGNIEFQKCMPMEQLFERYGLTARMERWRKLENEFLARLRNEKILAEFHKTCCCRPETIHANRQRMNYPEEEYQRRFVDIFRNADTRKLVLFGSGLFAKTFIELYAAHYPVFAIVDNNRDRWGQMMGGLSIQSPELLKTQRPGEYKVIICIKNYLSVMKQLNDTGIGEYSIYDMHRDYRLERRSGMHEQRPDKEEHVHKPYHTGYIAGVFDLFHIGHLNMFQRAKEQCDYLIAGVVSDEGVRRNKKTEPFIPFEERVELVRACRYVDEVVGIPLNHGYSRDAWRLYHFDCQFSGSDYADHPDWLAEQEFLQRHGAQMVFFPYTESTSSTKIRAMIEKKLV